MRERLTLDKYVPDTLTEFWKYLHLCCKSNFDACIVSPEEPGLGLLVYAF